MYKITHNRGLNVACRLRGKFRDVLGRLLNPGQIPRSPTVAMYHSVSEQATKTWGPWYYGVTPAEFEAQLDILDRATTVVSINVLVNWLMGQGSLPSNAVVLTFDDAYLDFLREAVPILERYEFPATVYIPTVALDEQPWTPFEHHLATALRDADHVEFTVDGLSVDCAVESHSAFLDCYEKIRIIAKRSGPNFRKRILEALNAEPPSQNRVVTPSELRELRDNRLITIGAHSHTHVPFTSLSPDEQREQVRLSQERLETVLGQSPRHFSFPYGSFDRSALRAVEDAGFESAVTTQSRRVMPRDWHRPYTIPRIDAANKPLENLPLGLARKLD